MKTSPSQNNYNERLSEKLQRQADKRGSDSPAAEELNNLTKPVEGVTPQRRAGRDAEDVTKDK